MGHAKSKQLTLGEKTHWTFRYSHGGILRNRRRGRKARPLSTSAPIHLVLKTNRASLRRGLRSPLSQKIVTDTLKRYSKKFFVKIEQFSIGHDHIHLLVRLSRRSLGQYFFRVVAGQIAQQFRLNGMMKVKALKLWKFRPFTRVIQGWKPYLIVRNYIQLNEKEARGEIQYKPQRLKGLSTSEWEALWN